MRRWLIGIAVLELSCFAGGVEVDGEVRLDGESASACDCDTQECRTDWVRDNMGCDVCVVFACDGQPPVHACAYCAPPASPARGASDCAGPARPGAQSIAARGDAAIR